MNMAMRHTLRKLRNISSVMYSSGILFTHCTLSEKLNEKEKLKLEPPDIKKLTYESMIQCSTLDVVNSATQALTVTCMAIINLSTEYRTLLNKLISLLTDTLNHDVSDVHWDLIVEVRTEMEEKKQILMKLTGYMDYVHKMAVATSEISFLSGMDSLSNLLCQRINDVLDNVKKEVESNLELEQAYRHIQEQCIKNSKDTVQ
ncbi:uncharacterized protein LOC105191004 isoform X2 [Harpegnathos saltator]|uniref:uncharacterized protein LOC105191004 isoform X2 n=1 Tax=Harpegnathos saltator TaxID=610380 RepID=UPI00058B793F|nr:uncharacterized protein LOC105191004 isoform X2 [Harpegnathos saltator]